MLTDLVGDGEKPLGDVFGVRVWILNLNIYYMNSFDGNIVSIINKHASIDDKG